MKIQLSSRFVKKSKRLSNKEQKILEEKLDIFADNPADSRLKVHQLAGRLKGQFAFSVTFSKRAIFIFADKGVALFIDVGGHDEVYR